MDKITFVTRKNNVDRIYYQSKTDKKFNSYTVQGNNCGGGGKIDSVINNDLQVDIANYLLGTYLFNDVKYLKQTTGEVFKTKLHYYLHFGNKPYFIKDNHPNINHPLVRCTDEIELTQENLIKLYNNGYFKEA